LHNLSYCEYTMETLGLNWVRLSYSHDLRVSLSQSQSMSWIVLVLCPVFLPKKRHAPTEHGSMLWHVCCTFETGNIEFT
jgi:hypothetical protein